MPLVQVQQGEPRKKHLLRQVLFSMISVPYGTDDISSIWYPLSSDDICLRHMKGTDIISGLRSKYIIRRKPYIILRQQYIMMHKAYIRRPFFIGFSSIAPAPSALWLSITLTDWAKRSRWQSLRCASGGGWSKQGLAQWSIFRERERARKIGYHKRKRDFPVTVTQLFCWAFHCIYPQKRPFFIGFSSIAPELISLVAISHPHRLS